MRSRPFLFVPVKKLELKEIERQGLSVKRTMYPTLKKARASGRRVLIVKREAVEKGNVRPQDILNLRPYRRAVSIAAGGGVLVRGSVDALETVLIFRRGKWDIAKGKRDRGESNRECAVRELQEELGVKDIRPVWKIGKTLHAYRARRRRYLVKTTHWYAMKTSAKVFIPQAKEKITDARWVPMAEAIEMVHFKALRKLLKEARRQVQAAGNMD
ncbi:MAG: 8-oxo-dGTP pyrophosphatase MutT (NUDIX family) [Rhodothermales bacterium]|jgi:8-oxo-dGTP pyrophosphatase MutT (NUDIX family)